MTCTPGFSEFLLDQLRTVGPVSIRRMFGGGGVFIDGLMFGLVSDDTLFLKADANTQAEFEAEGMEPFGYDTKDGRRMLTSYWRAPERLFDEPDEMQSWASKALNIARRANAKKSKPKASARSKASNGTKGRSSR